MINAEDEVLVDFSTSCTKDVAVAKMLGWMQGHRRKRVVTVTEHGISEEQLPYLYSLEGSLADHLIELREAASQELTTAAEKYASEKIRWDKDESGKNTAFEILERKEKAVAEYDALIDKAGTYLLDIEEELDKGKSSDLKIDQEATKRSGYTHLTINSVDHWARSKYGISIKKDPVSGSLPEDNPKLPQATQQEQESDRRGGLGKTKANNLYTTLAFLVEAFSKTSTKYNKDTGPNVKAIAEELKKYATETNNKEKLSGQSSEAIKDRIEEAMKIRKSKLPGG